MSVTPSKISALVTALTNKFALVGHTHSNYISTSSTTGLIKNDGSIMTSGTGSSNYAAGNHTHSGYATSTHYHGHILSDGKVDKLDIDTEYTQFTGVLGTFGKSSDLDYDKLVPTTLIANYMTDSSAYSNIGTSANATQKQINTGINTALGNKLSATKVTSWSSTPSDSNVASEKLVKDSLDDIEDLIGDAISYINQ